MEKKVITTPIKTEDIKDLRVGDMIYLTGMMVASIARSSLRGAVNG